jgi:hypothetical protein
MKRLALQLAPLLALLCALPVFAAETSPATATVADAEQAKEQAEANTPVQAEAVADEATPDTPPPPDPERMRALLEQRARLEARVEELELQGGSAATELQQVWMDLGLVLDEMQLHAEAGSAFDAAWQSVRSNGGLEDPQQLTPLRHMLASQHAQQDWEQADVTSQLIHHISRRAHAPGSDARLDGVLQLGRWKLLAARDELLENPLQHAQAASTLYQQEIQQLLTLEPWPARNLQLATLHLERASAEYLVASQIRDQPLQDYVVGGQRSTTMVQCQLVRLPDGRVQQLCAPVEIPNIEYYVDPTNRKNQEMWRHLDDMKDGIQAAYQYLTQETQDAAARDLLLEDMQILTGAYNEFVTGNGQ